MMRQLVLAEPGRFEAKEVEEPIVPEGHALVKVHRMGVCGTDLNAFGGTQPFFNYPRVIGHELGVEIVAFADSQSDAAAPLAGDQQTILNIGDRCAIEPYSACGDCRMCDQGRRNCCPTSTCLGVHIDGGMQDLLAIATDRLHPSKLLSFDELALVETLGIGAHAIQRAAPQPKDQLLIIGAGPIGLAVLEFAKQFDVAITIIDRDASRRTFAAAYDVSVAAELPAKEFDLILDATGNKNSMEAAVGHLAFGGTIVFVGIVTERLSFDDPTFHRRELTIKATRNSAGLFPEIIAKIETGKIDLKPWISRYLDFDHVPSDFKTLRQQPGLVKAIIRY